MGEQLVNLGYQQLTVSNVAVGLTFPTGGDPHYALIRTTGAVRWRDDGTAPTAAIGVPMNANESLEYDGKLSKIKFIRQSVDATLDISYYRFGGSF